MSSEPSMFCRACGYPLDALTTPRCPECGHGFNPSDDLTFGGSPEHPILRRHRTASILVWFLGSIPITGFAWFLAVLSGGAGHGNYFFAKLLFPFSMYWAGQVGTITNSMIVLGLAQFPLYAVVIGGARKRDFGTAAFVPILVIHFAFVAACLTYRGRF
jgi:hypothetical protein